MILAVITPNVAPLGWPKRFAAQGGDIRFDTRWIDPDTAQALVEEWGHRAAIEMHAGSVESRRKAALLASDAILLQRALTEARRWRQAAQAGRARA